MIFSKNRERIRRIRCTPAKYPPKTTVLPKIRKIETIVISKNLTIFAPPMQKQQQMDASTRSVRVLLIPRGGPVVPRNLIYAQ